LTAVPDYFASSTPIIIGSLFHERLKIPESHVLPLEPEVAKLLTEKAHALGDISLDSYHLSFEASPATGNPQDMGSINNTFGMKPFLTFQISLVIDYGK
jgi:hypothetical protein